VEHQSARAAMPGAAAAHIRVLRADGTIEHYSSFSRPQQWWNLRLWWWLGQRWLEYRQMEKADA